MKQLVCEMCGSTDIVKQEGVFVCQICGCKYSVEEARKMMIEGTVQVEGTVKIDNSEQLKIYKDMAINAYNNGSTKEAYQYFLKVLELDPKDIQAIFYRGMCQGWESTLANPRIGEAMSAYQQASNLIPDEIAQSIRELFISDLLNLINEWFDKARERVWDTDEWYSYNVDTFWDYLGVCEKVINYLDVLKPVFLKSESGAFRKNFGQLYCDACYGLCTHIVEWTSYSKDSATFPGLSLQRKQPILKKYDDIIFEVRKYDPKFKKLEVKSSFIMGTIDRAAPPTRIGPHNTAISRQNDQNCLRIDREIDQRVAQWRDSEAKRIKAEKEKKYWDSHPEDKARCEELKKEYDESVKAADEAKSTKTSAEAIVKQQEDIIRDMNSKISTGNDLIAKQQKKIFGKVKAQEVIAQTQREIEGYQETIAETNQALTGAKANRDDATIISNKANSIMQSAKNEYESFLKKCGL